MATDLEQAHFRFRTDANAADASPTWGDNEDANYNPGASPFRLRMGLANLGDASSGSLALYLQKNAGSYAAITTASAGGVKSYDASSDADDTPIRIPRLSMTTAPAWPLSLLLHFDGIDGSTTFTDATGRHTLTASGNTQIDTAQSKFGGASMYSDGTTFLNELAVDTNNNDDFSFPGDFTIDFQYHKATSSLNNVIMNSKGEHSRLTAGAWAIHVYSNRIYFAYDSVGVIGADITEGQFIHVELTRAGTTLRLFLDGVVSATAEFATALTTDELIIGVDDVNNYFTGWIDELRIIKGFAAHTANFTPPTEQYN